MARNTDEKARGLTPVRNGKVAGAIPAESTKLLEKKFYQEAERDPTHFRHPYSELLLSI